MNDKVKAIIKERESFLRRSPRSADERRAFDAGVNAALWSVAPALYELWDQARTSGESQPRERHATEQEARDFRERHAEGDGNAINEGEQ